MSVLSKTIDYEALWVSIPYPCFVIGRNNRITAANYSAEALCLQSLKNILSQSIDWYLGENSLVTNAINQSRDSLSLVALYDVEISWLKSVKSVFDVMVTPINDYDQNILLIFHPKGNSQKMDRSLVHRSAARSVTGMASMLAHEIRNPLAGISGAAQLVISNASEEDAELLNIIHSEVDRISKLVESFQIFGDISSTKFEAVNIHNVVNQAMRLAIAGYAADIVISERYDPSLPLAKGNQDLLLQVIQNLLKNAAEAVPKTGGQIIIETSYKQGLRINLGNNNRELLPLQVSIIDNGQGIPNEIKDDIFDPFVTTKVKGSGLGLSLVSKIMADHGGIVEYSRWESKTIFTLLLPVWNN